MSHRYVDIPAGKWLGRENELFRRDCLRAARQQACNHPGVTIIIRLVEGKRKTQWASIVCYEKGSGTQTTHTTRRWG